MTRSIDSMPSLAEWAGSGAALAHLFRGFYERVREDEILSIVFQEMAPDHAARVRPSSRKSSSARIVDDAKFS